MLLIASFTACIIVIAALFGVGDWRLTFFPLAIAVLAWPWTNGFKMQKNYKSIVEAFILTASNLLDALDNYEIHKQDQAVKDLKTVLERARREMDDNAR